MSALPRLLPARSTALAILLAGCAAAPPPAPPRTEPSRSPAAEVDALADEYFAAYVHENPDAATMSGLPGADHARLPDNSLDALASLRAREDAWLARLSTIDARALRGAPQWVTYGFLREALESSREARVCRFELWPVNQMSGWHLNLGELASRQPVGNPRARADAIARWRSLRRFVDVEIANLREGLRLGYSTPKHNVELTIEQLDGLLALPTTESPFWDPAKRDPALTGDWKPLVEGEIVPAIRRYRDFLRAEYLPKAREAVAANPRGAECYRAALRQATSLDTTGEAVYRDGEAAVARREAAMREVGQRVYGTSDLAAIRAKHRADAANQFKDRDDILATSRTAIERARAALPKWFGHVPAASVSIDPIPGYAEQSTFSHYDQPAEDGSHGGTYYIRLFAPETQDRGDVEVTAFHETYPGHHLQISIALERPRAAAITRVLGNSGYIEGWARYTESLADEMGLYSSDKVRLSLFAGAPTGMVVDPGVHVMGWSRQQAIDYKVARGSPPRDAEAYVDRIAVWPGQMTTYGVGELTIAALRAEAQKALGARFDVRHFHDVVLSDGSVTLPMLKQKVEEWVAAGG